MKLREYLLKEFDREVERSRRALKEVPDGKYEWKPHEKSMICGYLADMVATIPMWIAMEVSKDEFDIAPKDGSSFQPGKHDTSASLLKALDESAAGAREAFGKTTDDHLLTNWKLLVGGNVVQESPRYEAIQDTIHHWCHHRGQLTVYLRLMGAKVPAIYGPSADDKRFDM